MNKEQHWVLSILEIILFGLKIIALGIYMSFWDTGCLSCEKFTDTIPQLALAALVFFCLALLIFVVRILGHDSGDRLLLVAGYGCFVVDWILNVALWIVAAEAIDGVDGCCESNPKHIKGLTGTANVLIGVFVIGEPILLGIRICTCF